MRRPLSTLLIFFTLLALPVSAATATAVDVSLRGSPGSMVRQNQVAKKLGYAFLEKPSDLARFLEEGTFVPLRGNEHYMINDGVSYPYARPEVRMFIERLAEQYHEGTGEKLVVTSLTRPESDQPRNSHDLSVHPAGIAVDFRVSSQRRSRAWLESVLLKLERQKLLDITRERWPPHYHVAVFPEAYRTYVEGMIGKEAVAEALNFEEVKPEPETPVREAVAAAVIPPASVVATAVPAVEPAKPSMRTLAAALPLSALLFFLLGYWRGTRQSDGAEKPA